MKPLNNSAFLCTDGFEHRIGHNAVDSGNGARPQGPQICLNCRQPLGQLIKADRKALLTELQKRGPDKKIANYNLRSQLFVNGYMDCHDQVTTLINQMIEELK